MTKTDWREGIYIGLLLTGFMAVNLLTSTRFPIPWYDEVQFVDPAANLFFNNRFSTTAYSWERATDFHAHHPLYSLMLAQWFKATGFGLAYARALNYVMAGLTAVIIWYAVKRIGLVPSTTDRLLLILLLILGYSVSFPYRAGRIEPLMMFLSALAFLVFTMENRRWRIALLGGMSLFFAPAGLHLVVFSVVVSLLLLLYVGKGVFPEVSVIWIGVLVSVASLFLFYAMNGVWENALAAIRPHTASGGLGALWSGQGFNHHNRIPKDPSLVVLLGVLAAAVAVQMSQGQFRWRSLLSFGLVASAVIPLTLLMTAKFPTYYSWMLFVPLAVSLCSTVATVKMSALAKLGVRGGLVMACSAGLPLQLMAVTYDWQDRDYGTVHSVVAASVAKDDWVLCDYSAYFAVKTTAEQVFLPDYLKLLTKEEKMRVTLLIGSHDAVKKWREQIGGNWAPVSQSVLPQQITIIQRLTGKNVDIGLIGKKYHLTVYKRQS